MPSSIFTQRHQEFIAFIASVRKAADITQVELAGRVGVTRQTLIAIEQGRYSPTLELAFQIARVFGVGLDDVFQYPQGES